MAWFFMLLGALIKCLKGYWNCIALTLYKQLNLNYYPPFYKHTHEKTITIEFCSGICRAATGGGAE
jgi:hypothetical protein